MHSGGTQGRIEAFGTTDGEQPQSAAVTSSSAASSASGPSPSSPLASYQAQPMDEDCRELLRRHFEEQINRKAKFELVAAFTIVGGDILAFAAYRQRVAFQLTERRRRIIRTYYRSGEHNLLLYVNSADSEHYMPLRYITRDCLHQRRLRRRYQEVAARTAAANCDGAGGRGGIGAMLAKRLMSA